MRLPILLASVIALTTTTVLSPLLLASESTPKSNAPIIFDDVNRKPVETHLDIHLPLDPATKQKTNKIKKEKKHDSSQKVAIQKMIDNCFPEYKTPKELSTWVENASKQFGVKPSIILSIIAVESGFRERAVNSGNVGLMQIHARSWELPKRHLLDGEKNVLKGTEVFADYRKQLGGSDKKALHAYNKGITAYKNGARNSKYVNKVLRNANRIESGKPLELAKR